MEGRQKLIDELEHVVELGASASARSAKTVKKS